MRNLIIYASRYGCTAECASELSGLLASETDVLDIEKQCGLDLTSYDRVLVGSSVYMGQINKKIKKFCEDSKAELMKKELVIFICSGLPENFADVINANFDGELAGHAIDIVYFGGLLDLQKMNFMDKTIAKLMAKQKGEARPRVEIDRTAIKDLAQRLNEEEA